MFLFNLIGMIRQRAKLGDGLLFCRNAARMVLVAIIDRRLSGFCSAAIAADGT